MSDPSSDQVQDLAAAYALGALSPEESRRFEAYLATSAEARREVDEYREAAALLALGDATAAPDPALRRRVLDGLGRERTTGMPARGSRLLRGALAASLVAAAGLGAALLATRGELASVRAQLRATAGELTATAERLAAREATLNAIFEPGVRMFQLTASGDPDPGIQLFWDTRRHRAILHGFRLDQVPSGRAYQLWFIEDGTPVPSVTFKPEPDGHVKIEDVTVPRSGTVSAAAVTLEPETGSPQPTSPILLVGQLQRS